MSSQIFHSALRRDLLLLVAEFSGAQIERAMEASHVFAYRLLLQCVSFASAVSLLRPHALVSSKTAADLRMKASKFGVETSI